MLNLIGSFDAFDGYARQAQQNLLTSHLATVKKNFTTAASESAILQAERAIDAAQALINRGALEVHVYITHGVLSGEAVKKIKESKIKNMVITDTIDNFDKVKKAKNIEVLTISNLLGEAIKRISNSTSVSDLFK